MACTITNVAPNVGLTGTLVNIIGTGFGSSQGGSTVLFNGTNAGTAFFWSDTLISIAAPSGATSGRISVTVGGIGQDTNSDKTRWFSYITTINIRGQDESADTSPEDWRYADAGDLNRPLAGLIRSKYIDGLRPVWVSTTQITVEKGGCVSIDGAYHLELGADASVPIGTVAAFPSTPGLDEQTLAATATTHGTRTFEPSASIWTEVAMARIVRNGTGTITGAGTTITGTSTKFLTELGVGDVIRSSDGAATGASRVTAIASDTSLTIAAAFPGGSPAGSHFTVYENLTIWPDTGQAGDKRRPDTITNAGTSVVTDAGEAVLTSSGAGKTMKIGVEPTIPAGAFTWFYPWLVTDGTNTTVILSTQRTTPLLGSILGKRLLGAVVNNASENLDVFFTEVEGRRSYTSIANAQWNLLNAGTQATYTRLAWEPLLPPISTIADMEAVIVLATGGTNDTSDVIALSLDGSNANVAVSSSTVDNAEHRGLGYARGFFPRANSKDRAIYYKVTSGANDTGFLNIVGWEFER